ncbi:MAG: DUF1549 domain-containing protein, partial [Planctomycetes bacterium]|nr:DUF1549 domain-containing protein [Planctomycetota bacterium]
MHSFSLATSSLAFLWFAAASTVHAENAAPNEEATRFFESRIRPLLAEHCFACHGPEKQKSGLRLDTAEGFQRGGDWGRALISKEKPETSFLLKAVRHEEPMLSMPPKGKLKDSQIADLTRWVKLGAPYPKPVAAIPDNEKHWAFQPIVDPPLPAIKNEKWSRSAIDRFILAELEAKGLQPAPAADLRILIRRVTFDLTGLPPSPTEVEEFLRDSQSKPDAAYETLIDRLLVSPHYGERWGRHWLDVARYADSNGLDENVAHGNAWRYRDYVVAAFNDDKPYDQFLREQIAGDLLSGDAAKYSERLIATGFLSLGPKVLAEPDEKKMEMDIVDEQVDTLGRAVMGMTLGCARCHDHKFDPLLQEDYYGMAGIFMSTRTMVNFKKVARWHENPIGTEKEQAAQKTHEAAVAKLKEAIKTAKDPEK